MTKKPEDNSIYHYTAKLCAEDPDIMEVQTLECNSLADFDLKWRIHIFNTGTSYKSGIILVNPTLLLVSGV